MKFVIIFLTVLKEDIQNIRLYATFSFERRDSGSRRSWSLALDLGLDWAWPLGLDWAGRILQP